jgi:hypothetical protein
MAHPPGRRPAAVFYPFGDPTPYADVFPYFFACHLDFWILIKTKKGHWKEMRPIIFQVSCPGYFYLGEINVINVKNLLKICLMEWPYGMFKSMPI